MGVLVASWEKLLMSQPSNPVPPRTEGVLWAVPLLGKSWWIANKDEIKTANHRKQSIRATNCGCLYGSGDWERQK